MWKSSYRLSLDKDNNKAFLQGWAIVENTTDEDWKEVSLGLISGRPISFRMDLYQPLYIPRPLVEPELFASLRPPTYSGAMEYREKAVAGKDRDKANRDEAGKEAGDGRRNLAARMTNGAGGGEALRKA